MGGIVSELLRDLGEGLSEDPRCVAALGEGLRELTSEPSAASLEVLIGSVERALAAQLAPVFAHPPFRALEAMWRGLDFVVSRVDCRQNLKVELLNVSKDDLLADFEDAPEIPKSGLYKLVYSAEYGPFGGRPYALMATSFVVDEGDRSLLERCAEVAAMAALPFLAEASPALISPTERWVALRARPASRFLGLCRGRALARAPHPAVADALWAPSSFAVAVTIARSFALWRLPIYLEGPVLGRLTDLPSHEGVSADQRLSSAEIDALEQAGILAIGAGAAPGELVVHRAPSVQAEGAPTFEGAQPHEAWAHRQLAHVLLESRVVHYLKVLQREQIGTWRERAELEGALNEWLAGLVAEDAALDLPANPEAERALRAALRERPDDASLLAVYADWLEQQGRSGEAWLARHGGTVVTDRDGSSGQDRFLRAANIHLRDGVSYWPSTLRLEPMWGIAGQPCALEIELKLDRE